MKRILHTVSATPEDYEASTWYRTQDLYKMGPKHQDTLAQLITMGIKRRADKIKWDALYNFTVDAPIADIGTGATVIDPRYLEQAGSEIAAGWHGK
ncbi:MAG: hypothetical protein U5K75_00070 [Ahrensia sp.]|nr:hypothetical protein [Ahrensia sp.]